MFFYSTAELSGSGARLRQKIIQFSHLSSSKRLRGIPQQIDDVIPSSYHDVIEGSLGSQLILPGKERFGIYQIASATATTSKLPSCACVVD